MGASGTESYNIVLNTFCFCFHIIVLKIQLKQYFEIHIKNPVFSLVLSMINFRSNNLLPRDVHHSIPCFFKLKAGSISASYI